MIKLLKFLSIFIILYSIGAGDIAIADTQWDMDSIDMYGGCGGLSDYCLDWQGSYQNLAVPSGECESCQSQNAYTEDNGNGIITNVNAHATFYSSCNNDWTGNLTTWCDSGSNRTETYHCSYGYYGTPTSSYEGCTICPPGAYCSGAWNPGETTVFECYDALNANYRDGDDATECTKCPDGYNMEVWGATSINQCHEQIPAGYYVPYAGANYAEHKCPAGYYCLTQHITYGQTTARIICPAGTYSRAGSDEPGDCGRILNIGENTLYLRSDKKTTPSLNVNVGGITYYGNMDTTSKGFLRINSGGTTYSIYDDGI